MKPIGVTRIADARGRGHGWMVRITRTGVTTHKWFADGQHGGTAKAKRAAHKHYRALEKSAAPLAPIKNRKTSRNKTGKVGVRLCDGIDRRKANVHRYLSYVAFWTGKNGRACTIGFSFNKYGEKMAFALASIARDSESRDRAWIEQEFNRQKRSKVRAGERAEV